MRNEHLNKYIKVLSEEYDLPQDAIREIVESPGNFLHDVMRNRCNRKEAIFPSVRIEGIGIFHCPDWKKEELKKLNNKNE